MKTVNTYGLKMVGLEEAAAKTKTLNGSAYSDHYVQLNYDMSTGEVMANLLCSLGQNSWVKYDDTNIIRAGNIFGPMSAQKIADLVKEVYDAVMQRRTDRAKGRA